MFIGFLLFIFILFVTFVGAPIICVIREKVAIFCWARERWSICVESIIIILSEKSYFILVTLFLSILKRFFVSILRLDESVGFCRLGIARLFYYFIFKNLTKVLSNNEKKLMNKIWAEQKKSLQLFD